MLYLYCRSGWSNDWMHTWDNYIKWNTATEKSASTNKHLVSPNSVIQFGVLVWFSFPAEYMYFLCIFICFTGCKGSERGLCTQCNPPQSYPPLYLTSARWGRGERGSGFELAQYIHIKWHKSLHIRQAQLPPAKLHSDRIWISHHLMRIIALY